MSTIQLTACSGSSCFPNTELPKLPGTDKDSDANGLGKMDRQGQPQPLNQYVKSADSQKGGFGYKYEELPVRYSQWVPVSAREPQPREHQGSARSREGGHGNGNASGNNSHNNVRIHITIKDPVIKVPGCTLIRDRGK